MNIISRWIGKAVLGGAFAAVAMVPGASDAGSITINNVTVTSTQGGDVQTWCMAGCADPDGGPIWATGVGTVVNSPNTAGNKNLILTQTGPNFNFDSSEHIAGGVVTLCSVGAPCTITILLNTSAGVINVPLPAANAINNFNNDIGGTGHQEAQNWTQVLDQGLGGVKVSIGYWDTAHSDACTDNNAGIGGQVLGNCQPDNPFQGSANTVFIGANVNNDPGCARPAPNATSCADAGTILIQLNDPPVQTPEPASMFLLGAGLLGLAAWGRKRKQ